MTIYRQIGNPLEATALGNIGNIYGSQGKLEEALESFQAALTIDREIGNPLGQAIALANIGLAYANQGKLEEALEHLKEAHAIFLQLRATIQLRMVEEKIERLNSMIGGDR